MAIHRMLSMGAILAAVVLFAAGPQARAGYVTEVTADNPVVWYRFNETSGSIVNSGSAGALYNADPVNDGGQTYGIASAFAELGTAINLGTSSGAGTGTHFIIPGGVNHYSTFLNTGPATLEFWVNTTQTNGASAGWNNPALMGEDNSTACCGGSGGDSWWGMLEQGPAPGIQGQMGVNSLVGGDRPVTVRTPQPVNDGAWHHLVMARSSTNDLTIYLDGRKVAQGNIGSTGYTFNALGRGSNGQWSHLDAMIDEVAIYTQELTLSDAIRHYVAAGGANLNNGRLSVNFAGGSSSNYGPHNVVGTAGVVPLGHWNNAVGAGQTNPDVSDLALVDSSGQLTFATLTIDAGNTWGTAGPTGTDNERLMKGYIDNAAGQTIRVDGLHGTFTDFNGYDVLVYYDTDSHGAFEIRINDSDGKTDAKWAYELAGDFSEATGFIESTATSQAEALAALNAGLTSNYVVLRGFTGTSFTFALTNGSTPWDDRARINGFQIIANVPEPSAFVLGAFGLLAVALAGWRRRR